MENKECVIELKTVQERTRSTTNIIESMGATIRKMDRKDWDPSIWEDRSWKDTMDTLIKKNPKKPRQMRVLSTQHQNREAALQTCGISHSKKSTPNLFVLIIGS